MIEASYRLDTTEQRLILLAIVQARDSGITITSDEWIEVTAIHYADICGLDRTTAYRQLKAAADSLFMRWVQMRGIDSKTGKEGVIKTRWVSACTYVDNSALVRLRIAPDIIPYVTDLQTCFTSYQLKNVVQMSSRYAIRLYELLAQYRSIGSRYITLPELKDYLDANDKAYNILQNFKNKVLKISIEQINLYTDLSVDFEPKKEGKTIVGYQFNIEQKTVEKTKGKKSLPSPTVVSASAPSLPQSLSIAERALLRDKQQLFPDLNLTESSVIEMARQQNTDVYLVLAGIK